MDFPEARELSLDPFRQYLLLLARLHLGDQARAKVDASDVVQETLLEAYRKRGQFRGASEAELAAWLRQMLAFSIAALTALNIARVGGPIDRLFICERAVGHLESTGSSFAATLWGTWSSVVTWNAVYRGYFRRPGVTPRCRLAARIMLT
jgi:hypothetical protein